MQRLRLCLVACVAVSVSTCGPHSKEGPDGGETVSAPIDGDGGVLTLDGVTLVVPAGSLSGSQEISITSSSEPPPDGTDAVSPLYVFGPDGLVFDQPVTVSFPPPADLGPSPDLEVAWSEPEDDVNSTSDFDEDGGVIVTPWDGGAWDPDGGPFELQLGGPQLVLLDDGGVEEVGLGYDLPGSLVLEGGVFASVDHFSKGFVRAKRDGGITQQPRDAGPSPSQIATNEISAANSSTGLSLPNPGPFANFKSAAVVTVNLRDASGNPVPLGCVQVHVSGLPVRSSGSFCADSTGAVHLKFASTNVGTATVTISVRQPTNCQSYTCHGTQTCVRCSYQTSTINAPQQITFLPAPGAPAAPVGVTAEPGDRSATVSWSPPPSDGASPITEYLVTTGGYTVKTGNTSVTVPHLTNGRSYSFTVVARNAEGNGPPSAPSAPVTPGTVPGSPTSVVATAANASATVTWAAPASNGGSAITGYVVTSSPGGVTASAGPNATTAAVSNLTNGTAYTFTVVAQNAWGNSAASAASAPVTPMTTPSAPSAVTATGGNAQATVSWAAAGSGGGTISKYTVVTNPGGQSLTASGTATSANVTGLTNGNSYSFSVYATNELGDGPSASSNLVTPMTVPGAPTGVLATGGSLQATVSWSPPVDNGGAAITGYTVTSSPGGVTATTTGTQVTVTGLSAGTQYAFTVTATNAAGTGPASAASNPVVVLGPPGLPTNVVATGGNAQATISWSAPSNNGGTAITGYTVTAQGVPAVTTTGTTVTVTSLTNGTAYQFYVTATNAQGNGPSAPANPVTPMTTPDAPAAVSAQSMPGAVMVSWQAPPNNGGSAITGYAVTASPGGATLNASSTNVTFSNLTVGQSYTFTVVAVNQVGNSPASAPSNAAIPEGVPTAPLNVTASPGAGQALVSWSPPATDNGSPVTGYTVLSSPGGIQVSVSGGTSATVGGLTNGTAYTFTVQAQNGVGAGPWSAPSSPVTPVSVPGAPLNVTATLSGNQATVSWAPPADDGGSAITGYTVTENPGGATVTTDGSTTSATFTGLASGVSYTFTVIATNAVGNGPSATSAPVTPVSPPGAPSNVTAAAGNQQATVSWATPASGGSPITSFTVTASPGGATVTTPDGSTTTVTFTGLSNGTSYTFTVYATNVAGNGPASAASNAVTPATFPGAPTQVSATAGNASATVTWAAPVDDGGAAITGYTVLSSPGGFVVNVSGSLTQATVSGLANGTSYTFTVTATNAVGSGQPSAPSNAVTPAAPVAVPDPPTNVAATAGNGQATVSWAAPANNGGSAITSYTVTSNPGSLTQTTADGSTTTLVFTGLTNGTPYTFTVVATNAAGNSAPSQASAPVTPQAPATAPGAPTSVTATAGNATAQVSWAAPSSNGGSPITQYTVTASPGGATQSTADGTTTSLTFPGLTNGTAYTFTVVAVNAIGSSPASSPSNAVTPTAPTLTPPGAPTNVSATPGDGQANVLWTPPANDGGSAITGYTITASPGGITVTVAGNATGAPVTGLTNGTSYTFTVYATNQMGAGPSSAPSNAVTPGTATPGAPTGVTATAGNATASVTWAAPSFSGTAGAITGYTVTSSPGNLTASTTGATTATVSGLANGTAYTFTVVATNAAGNGPASAASNPVTPTAPPTVPGAPVGVSASAGNGFAQVTWGAPSSNGGSSITGYTVTSNPGGAQASASGSSTSAIVNGLTNGVSYTFTVTATNGVGTGPASAPSGAVTPIAPPDAPTNVTANGGESQAIVSWSAPLNTGGAAITSYTVTSSPGGVQATTPDGSTTTLTVTGLVDGTTYSFTVTATNAAGSGPASSPSNAVLVESATPGAPTQVVATAGNAQATVGWQAPSLSGSAGPITSYTVTASPGGATATTPDGNTLGVTMTGLTNGTSYTFTVVATNAAGNGPASTASSPVMPATLPGAPTNVTATAGNGLAQVSWTAPMDNGGAVISSYTVTSNPSGGTATVSGTTAQVTGLTNGTSYTFTVTATNSVGTGPASSPSNAVVPSAPMPPGPPTNVTATAGMNAATVSWTAPSSNGGATITSYTVTSNPGNLTASVNGSTTTATVTGLMGGTSYTFTVTATNSAGMGMASSPSNPVTPTQPASPPGAPQNVTAMAGPPMSGQANVSWMAPTSDGGAPITSYTVTPNGPGGMPTTVSGSTTSTIVSGLMSGQSYTFTVTATNSAGTGPASMPSAPVMIQ